ncbi:MAG TPA: hypothetical protein VM598_04370, partial [Bdellovibrionota bacterium]|nr:hypothetical protein [Bdellovibrionota bacterium]
MKSALCAIILSSVFLTGCGRFIGNLRRDLDDTEAYSEPTYGGRWTERGLLAEDPMDPGSRYSAVGHSERSPESDGAERAGGRGWVTPEDRESTSRDRVRYGAEDDGQGQS